LTRFAVRAAADERAREQLIQSQQSAISENRIPALRIGS
jgi:hypothetical protein